MSCACKPCFMADRRGAAALEFALVAPVLLLLLFGMVAYGIYIGASHSVQQLAADAARVSIAGLDNAERTQLASRYIEENSDGYLFLKASALKVSVGPGTVDANQFKVAVDMDARELPIWNLYVPLPLPEPVITRASTIRIGGM